MALGKMEYEDNLDREEVDFFEITKTSNHLCPPRKRRHGGTLDNRLSAKQKIAIEEVM